MKKVEFKLKEEYIHLIQLLKVTSLVYSGGEAQMVVTEGMVSYNGEIDTRKRLKVRSGDKVVFNQTEITVV